VAAGEFRDDLYYRLNVVPITVPPLRERRSDIPLLCQFFLERLAQQKGLELKELHPEVAERLVRYDWPGNVRELENLLERLVVLAEGEVIGPESLPPKLLDEAPPPLPENGEELPAFELPPGGLDLKTALEQIERRLIAQALEQAGGVKAQAAALLGLNRTTLVQKLKKLGGLRYRNSRRAEK
jgi:DNA-binding NtrC family response regulator